MGEERDPPFGGRLFIVLKTLKSKWVRWAGLSFAAVEPGNLRLVDLWIFWQRNSGTGAMNDWLVFLGWLATAASFLLLSVLVLLPVN